MSRAWTQADVKKVRDHLLAFGTDRTEAIWQQASQHSLSCVVRGAVPPQALQPQFISVNNQYSSILTQHAAYCGTTL